MMLAAFLGAGVLATLAVALGCLALSPVHNQGSSRDNAGPWPVPVPAGWPEPWRIHQARGFGFVWQDRTGLGETPPGRYSTPSLHFVTLQEVGWPRRPFYWCSVAHSVGTQIERLERYSVQDVPLTRLPAIAVHTPIPPQPSRMLPLAVHPWRFVQNTFFWATCSAAVFVGATHTRRKARQLRGQCPNCGYPAATPQITVCPECGTSHHPH